MRTVTPKEWEIALTDGSYARTAEQLMSSWGTEYCCLGVLADLIGVDIKELPDGEHTDVIPEDITEVYVPWLSDKDQSTLAKINDDSHAGPDWSKLVTSDSLSVLEYINDKWTK